MYQVSVRRPMSFATPLTPPLALLLTACGSLHLAVNTRGWTFTSKKCTILDTPRKKPQPVSLQAETFTTFSKVTDKTRLFVITLLPQPIEYNESDFTGE